MLHIYYVYIEGIHKLEVVVVAAATPMERDALAGSFALDFADS